MSFSSNYEEARRSFREAAQRAGARLDALTLSARGAAGEELTIDVAILGDPRAEKLLIHSSGLHGVEGFAGSAVQTAALGTVRAADGVGLVFVHALNPYGMSWRRRVNESNVDLNRNFLGPNETYAGADPAYAALDPFLNQGGAFWPGLLANLWRLGFSRLKNAIVGGQYTHPRGLFYGGARLEEGPRLYKNWLRDNVGAPKRVVALDVHTGLGGYGREVLFCHTNARVPDIGRQITHLNATVGYKVRGGLESLTEERFPNAEWAHFTEEFGTYAMPLVLEALRAENLTRTGDQLMKRMSPDDEKWRAKVLTTGVETLQRTLTWLAKTE